MAYVVSPQVRIDVGFELLIFGAEVVSHIDYGIGLVFEPIEEGLVEWFLVCQGGGDIASAERENQNQFLIRFLGKLLGPCDDIPRREKGRFAVHGSDYLFGR